MGCSRARVGPTWSPCQPSHVVDRPMGRTCTKAHQRRVVICCVRVWMSVDTHTASAQHDRTQPRPHLRLTTQTDKMKKPIYQVRVCGWVLDTCGCARAYQQPLVLVLPCRVPCATCHVQRVAVVPRPPTGLLHVPGTGTQPYQRAVLSRPPPACIRHGGGGGRGALPRASSLCSIMSIMSTPPLAACRWCAAARRPPGQHRPHP